ILCFLFLSELSPALFDRYDTLDRACLKSLHLVFNVFTISPTPLLNNRSGQSLAGFLGLPCCFFSALSIQFLFGGLFGLVGRVAERRCAALMVFISIP